MLRHDAGAPAGPNGGEKREIAVDVRMLVATNRDLWAEAQAGRFREDLYFRLQVMPIVLAPLRRRVADIVPIAEHLLNRLSGARELTPEAKSALEAYRWPGNVRELLNLLAGRACSRRARSWTASWCGA